MDENNKQTEQFDPNEYYREKIKNNKGCAIAYYLSIVFGLVMFIWFINMVVSDFKESAPKPCEEYHLSRYANSVEDLLITHEATGVITNRYLGSDKYIVEVNSKMWQQASLEQRSLIRCCAKEKAKQNGLKSLVIDEKGIDY